MLIFVGFIGILIWPLPGFIVLLVLVVILGFYDLVQKKHTILRNFPVIGHIR